MPLENSAGIKVLNSYGPRSNEGKFGAVAGSTNNKVRTALYEFDYLDLPATSSADARYVKTGLDIVFPTGTKFIRSYLIGETTVTASTAVTVGTFTFDSVGAITAVAADNIHVAATAIVGAFAAGETLAGTGAALLLDGAAATLTTAPTIIRCLPTGAAATAGKFALMVEYFVPTA